MYSQSAIYYLRLSPFCFHPIQIDVIQSTVWTVCHPVYVAFLFCLIGNCIQETTIEKKEHGAQPM